MKLIDEGGSSSENDVRALITMALVAGFFSPNQAYCEIQQLIYNLKRV
jgi:hypothetical protein